MCRIHPEAQWDLNDLNNFISDNTLQGTLYNSMNLYAMT